MLRGGKQRRVCAQAYLSIHSQWSLHLTSDASDWAITSQGAMEAGVELENFHSTSAFSSASILQPVGVQKHHYDCRDLRLLAEEWGG